MNASKTSLATRLSIVIISLLLLLGSPALFAQNHTIIQDLSQPAYHKKALIILPGFGDRSKHRKKQAAYFAQKGFDLFIPDFRDRKNYQHTLINFSTFMQDYKLEAYDEVVVFSYILGSWIINDYINRHPDSRISSIVYDRSPIQERAPAVVAKKIPGIVKILRGKLVIAFTDIPYVPIEVEGRRVGIIVENKATKLMRMFRKETMRMGSIHFGSAQFNQSYTDLMHTCLNHDEMYYRFDVIGEEVLHFFERGSFSDYAKRTPYEGDPFKKYRCDCELRSPLPFSDLTPN